MTKSIDKTRKTPGVRRADTDAILRWRSTPPTKHHLIYWDNTSPCQLTFENPQGLLTTRNVQPIGDGWLIAESRGGLARIFDNEGNLHRTLDLGDAIHHVQTTPVGNIWVGYFDEGVYGGGIGGDGLVCFDSAGTPIFIYLEFAKQHNLPCIDDCYTLNVVGSSAYVSYYSDFPLIWLDDFNLRRVWNDFGANSAVAVRRDHFVIFPAYHKPYLIVRLLDSSKEIIWELVDAEGRLLSKLAGGPPDTTPTGRYVPFSCVARDNHLYVYDHIGLYELPKVD